MINNPTDADGKDLFFPGAPAPDLEAHRAATWANLLMWVPTQPSYARWRAGTMAAECPEWHGDMLTRLDAYMAEQRIQRPPVFVEFPSRLPVLIKGRPGLSARRYFHDTL